MSCIACEEFAKRITNLYRDPELREKYEFVVGVKIFTDCFICDACNDKVVEMFAFRERCLEIYNRLYPPVEEETTIFVSHQDQDNSEPNEESEYVYYDETQPETQEYSIQDEEIAQKTIAKSEHQPEDSMNEYEGVVFVEYNDEQPTDETFDISNVSKSSDKTVTNRSSYTVEEKLAVIAYAEKNKNRLAARKFNINESTVRCFRKQKEALLKMSPGKKTNRRGTIHFPKLEEELTKYVSDTIKSTGTKVKMREIREKAIELADKQGIENFSGSNSFIFKFMERHKFPVAKPRPRKKV